MIDRLHHVAVVVPDADQALTFYRDIMGLEVTADAVMEEQEVRGVLLALGENEIELIQPVTPDSGVARFLESRGPTLHHYCFNTDNIVGELSRIKSLGDVELIDETPRQGLAGQVAFIHPKSMRGVLVELAQPPAGAHVSAEKGIDHLAAAVSDFEEAAALWDRVLGISVTGELRPEGSGMVIGQLQIGQAIIELLAPLSPDAGIAKQITEQGEGARPVVAIEVDDITAEVARYRAAGVTLDDPAPGVLPNSVRTSISAEQGYGLSIQLISYAGS